MKQAIFATVVGDEVILSVCLDVEQMAVQMLNDGVSTVVFFTEYNENFYTVVLAEGSPLKIEISMSYVALVIDDYIRETGEYRLKGCLTEHAVQQLREFDNDLD